MTKKHALDRKWRKSKLKLAVLTVMLLSIALVHSTESIDSTTNQEFIPAIITDVGDLWGANGEFGHQPEVGFNGETYFMLAQANPGEGNQGIWGSVQCKIETPGDQIKVFTAPSISGPWEPRGGNIDLARITPCDGKDFPLPTTWGVGSLWKYGKKWYATIDAGHKNGLASDPIDGNCVELGLENKETPDDFKFYVYLITSDDGINWEPITHDRRIIDGSNVDEAQSQLFLLTTVIPTSHSRVGFFFWTRKGCGTPDKIGYGQIELNPGSNDPNGVAVYLLRDDGQYVLLPEDGKVNFDVMEFKIPGGNPRPHDAYLTSGLNGQLLTFSRNVEPSLFGCPSEQKDQKVTKLNWTPFTLTDLQDPRLVIDDDWRNDSKEKNLIDQGPAFNPRNGELGIIDPDVFVDVDGRTYLIDAEDNDCMFAGHKFLRIHLYELNAPKFHTYSETFTRPNEADLSYDSIESVEPLDGHPQTLNNVIWRAHNMQLFGNKARPNSSDSSSRADIAINGAGALKVTLEAKMIAKSPNRTLYLGFPHKKTGKFGSFGSTLWLEVKDTGDWAIKNRYGGTTYTIGSGIFNNWKSNTRYHYKLVYETGSPKKVSLYFNGSSIPTVANLTVPKPVNLNRAGFQFTRDVAANLNTYQADADGFKVTIER
jgi:hypothetical protein